MNNIKNLEAALWYRSISWSVIPVRVIPGANGKVNKKPLITWGEFQNRIASEEEIRDWYAKWPDAGVGIATGKLSNLVVVDLDLGGDVSKFNLPQTVQSKTGSGGSHYFFTYPAGHDLGNSASLLGPKIDIRAEGGYVVVPPTHYSGNAFYEWINSPENSLLAPLPESILNALNPGVSNDSWKEVSLPPKKYEQTEPINEGEGRNNAAASYVGLLLNKIEPAMWESVAWPALQEWDRKMCRPSLGKELRQVFDSMSKRDLRNNPLKASLSDKTVSKEAIYAQLKKDFFHVDDKGRKKVSPFGVHKIAKYFVENYNVKTIGGEKSREIYLYDGGVYKPEGSSFFKAELEKILEEAWNTHWQSEIVEKIKNLSFIKREDFTVDIKFINLKNGVYNIETKELLPHSPDFLFLHQIPIDYLPSAECPFINRLFRDTLEADDVELLYEWLGFSLYRRYFIKKALIFVGVGNTSKTTLLNVISRFIGPSNFGNVELQKMSTNTFATAQLYEKHLNICDELSANDVEDNGKFKIATGDGPLPGEYKFGDSFSFVNFAKLLFACNKIPAPVSTDDSAYFSRWMVVEFKNVIAKEKMNKFLLRDNLTDQELSGLLNKALKKLDYLLAGNDFTYKKDTIETKVMMLKSNSSIAAFVYDRLEKAVGVFTSSDRLYAAYVEYTNANDLATESADNFTKNLPKYAGYAVKKTGVEVVTQVRGFGNVKIKDQANDAEVPF